MHKKGTWDIFQLVNIANRFLWVFSKLDTKARSTCIFPKVHGNPIFSTRLISLSKPHPKIMKIISNNSKNNVKHKKIEKHKMESEIKFGLIQLYLTMVN